MKATFAATLALGAISATAALASSSQMGSTDFDELEARSPLIPAALKAAKAAWKAGKAIAKHRHHGNQKRGLEADEEYDFDARGYDEDELEARSPLLGLGKKVIGKIFHHHHNQKRGLEAVEEYDFDARDYDEDELLTRGYDEDELEARSPLIPLALKAARSAYKAGKAIAKHRHNRNQKRGLEAVEEYDFDARDLDALMEGLYDYDSN